MQLFNFMRGLLVVGVLPCTSLLVQQTDFPQNDEAQESNQVTESDPKSPWETVEGTAASESDAESNEEEKESPSTEAPSTRTPFAHPEPKEVEAALDLADYQSRLRDLKKLQRIEAMVETVIPSVLPCVVSIGETATGVIVKPSGIVITASHVTQKAGRTLIIRLQDGRTVKGITLGSNAANDTSAIQLLGGGTWPYLKTVSPDYTAQAGQWCVAFGYPLSWPRDKPASARIGRVTGQYRGKIVTDCPIMGGDSGGALVDLNGNLLGINSSVRLDVTQNLHVPIDRYRQDWQYMMSRQDVDIATATVVKTTNAAQPAPKKNPYLGIYGESSRQSVRIRDIRRDSPAEKAGLLPEDVIWKIDESRIESFAELLKYLATRTGGDQITVGINRFGVNLDIVVTLDQR